jgi:hypothetical protein
MPSDPGGYLQTLGWRAFLTYAAWAWRAPSPLYFVAGFIPAAMIIAGRRLSRVCPGDQAWPPALARLGGKAVTIAGALFIGALLGWTVLARDEGALSPSREAVATLWIYVFRQARFLLAGIAFGAAAGVAAAVRIGRKLEPALWLRARTRRLKADELTDVRRVAQLLPRPPRYEHAAFFARARKADAVFLGVDENRVPVLVPRRVWVKSNVQMMGVPGAGKTVQASVALWQGVANGDAVFAIDPKADEWLPSVLAEACETAGKPFRYIDLRAAAPQFNPLAGIAPHELDELFVAGFGLGRQGEAADFYRLDDRKASRSLARALAGTGATVRSMCAAAAEILGEKLGAAAKGFLHALEELADIAAIDIADGLDLREPLRKGGCVYITGSLRHDAILMLQRMLLIRLMQLVEGRERAGRHVSIFLDEYRYMVSQPALSALGTARDCGCNVLLAHQSLGDLGNVAPGLEPAAVRATTIDNTPIKWLYRSTDEATAQWVAGLTGTIPAASSRMSVARNDELAEVASSHRDAMETRRYLIDTNMVQHLPDGCAVCVGAGGPARLAFARPIRVRKRRFEVEGREEKRSDGTSGTENGRAHDDLLTRLPGPA